MKIMEKKIYYVMLPNPYCETIEYKMSKFMAKDIIEADKTKRHPQEVLCEYVNTQLGLKGFCVRVHLEEKNNVNI